ncbi:hypothetical protein QQ045_028230 [Rhodiola kirilowii]
MGRVRSKLTCIEVASHRITITGRTTVKPELRLLTMVLPIRKTFTYHVKKKIIPNPFNLKRWPMQIRTISCKM